MKKQTQPRRRKPGGGRKPKYGEATVQLQARVPPVVRAKLIDKFETVQNAVDSLIIEPVLAECDRLEAAQSVARKEH